MDDQFLSCAASDRLLVWAPHPDDETLACGGLIQRTLVAGGSVRIVFATDGDNNPWPQRLAERRLRLDVQCAPRWGQRRRLEAREALRILGVPDPAVQFFGWPDQGLTRCLVEDGVAHLDQVMVLLREFAPTRIAMPSQRDTHPDHSASSVLLRIALHRLGNSCQVLEYDIHGLRHASDTGRKLLLSLTPEELARKREAALAHASQTLYGKGRLLRFVSALETYVPEFARAPAPDSGTWRWRFRLPRWLSIVGRPRLHLLAMHADGRLSRKCWPISGAARQARPSGVRIRRLGDRIEVVVQPVCEDARLVFAKIETIANRWLVYDTEGWAEIVPPSAVDSDAGAIQAALDTSA